MVFPGCYLTESVRGVWFWRFRTIPVEEEAERAGAIVKFESVSRTPIRLELRQSQRGSR